MVLEAENGEPDFLLLADVPVPLLVKVCEAHIVTVDFADFLAGLFDLAANPILSFHAILSGFVPSLKTISLVCKSNLSSELMAHISHENVEDVVSRVVKSNPLPILEDDLLEALRDQVGRLHAHLDAVEGPSVQLVVFVRALDQKVRHRWMMTGLFHKDHCTVLADGLECFAQDGVQRLLEDLLLVEEGQIVRHE